MGKLLIVGSVNIDSIETPFGKADKIVGGSAPYIALAASQFNVESAIVSVIGEDFPKEHLDLLQSKNVDLSSLEIVKGGKTFFWEGKYHNDLNSRDTITTELNVLADFTPVVPENFKDAKVVMLGNLHPSVQLSVIKQMSKKPELIILDTMNFWMDNTLTELKEVIKEIDVLTINDEEARQLTGEYSLVKAANSILKMGPSHLVIKKGEHGALLFHKEQIFFAPALPLEEVFDPTGAGDTFAGGFAGYLAATENVSFDNLKNAVIQGSNLASFSVEKFGTERLENLEKEEVLTRLNTFKTLTQFDIEL